MTNSLTPHQLEIKEQSLEILSKEKRLLIKGSAGVGKTFMVNDLLQTLAKKIPSYKEIYCSATTNKAVSVLAGKIDYQSDILKNKKVSLLTIHSVLKINKKTNPKTGKITFEPTNSEKYPPLKNVELLIIDEASMIGEQMLKWIEDHATRNNTTVIFIGDEKQINPVGESDSAVFHYGYPEVELTEIVRQGKGNPIITLSRNLHCIDDLIPRLQNDELGFLYTNNFDKVINELALVNGSDDLKYIAWTNNEIDRVNSLVREKIYTNPKKIELNESLIFDSPYDNNTYFTNEEIKVETLDVANIEFRLVSEDINTSLIETVELKCYIINGYQIEDVWEEGKMRWKGIFVIHEDSEEQYEKLLLYTKNKCTKRKLKYVTRNAFIDNFANLKYNHAITVHKSQGSTFRRAILNVKNIKSNKEEKERTRLLYTGVTRASNLLILYNA